MVKILSKERLQADAVLHSVFKKNGISPAVYSRKFK